MLFEAGSNGENIEVKDDILRIEIELPCKYLKSAVGDINFSFASIGLTLLIK